MRDIASCRLTSGPNLGEGLVKSFKFKEVQSTDGNAKTYVGSVVLSDRHSQLEMLAKILGAL